MKLTRDPLAWASAASVGAVLIKFLAAGVTATLGSLSITLSPTDSATIAAILTPTLGAYVASRHTSMQRKEG